MSTTIEKRFHVPENIHASVSEQIGQKGESLQATNRKGPVRHDHSLSRDVVLSKRRSSFVMDEQQQLVEIGRIWKLASQQIGSSRGSQRSLQNSQASSQEEMIIDALTPTANIDTCDAACVFDVALLRLKCDLLLQLNILHNKRQAVLSEAIAVPHRVFSWSREDFIDRRLMTNVAWIQLMISRTSRDHLNILKYNFDVKELICYIGVLLEAAIKEKTDETERMFNDMLRFLDVHEEIDSNLKLSKSQFKGLLLKFDDLASENITDLLEMQQEYALRFENYIMVAAIGNRFRTHFSESKMFQNVSKTNQRIEGMAQEMAAITKAGEIEKCRHDSTLNLYYSTIASLKSQIEQRNLLYDQDFELAELSYDNVKAQIDKLNTHEKFLEEEMERFDEEIELMEKRIATRMERERLEAMTIWSLKLRRQRSTVKSGAKRSTAVAKPGSVGRKSGKK